MSKGDTTLAEEVGRALELDGYVKTKEVCALTGFTRQWLGVKIKRGEFPPPDYSNGNGGHRWRRSTVKHALDAMETKS